MSEFTLDSLLDSLSDAPAETQIEKAASVQVSVADKLKDTLTKEASASTLGDTNMSVETGNAIADSILEMLDNGMNKEASNNVAEETADMVVDQDEAVTSTPREGLTVTQVAKALAAKANADEDEDFEEGNVDIDESAVPSDIEKSAAINELMEEGFGLEDAFEMVKQASFEIEMEVHEFEKVAAVNALIEEGIDFEDACELVKQASEYMMEEEVEEYSDLEKTAAINELMEEDGLCLEDAYELVKEAASVKEVAVAAGGAAKRLGKRGYEGVKTYAKTVAGKGPHSSQGIIPKGMNADSAVAAIKESNKLAVRKARKQLAAGTAGTALLGAGGYAATR